MSTSKTVDFLGVAIVIGPDALVPREETELLGRTAMDKLGAGRTIVDVCCGTANLACAIATLVADVRGWALDLTDGAVALARTNVTRLSLDDRITVAQGDLFAPIGDAARGSIDVVVCNPPYISTAKLAARTDLAEEPREAFDGGPYGVTIHQRVAREALALLRPGGWLVMEHGVGQDRQVKIAVERARGYDAIEVIADEAGTPRVIAARRSATPHE